MDSCQYLGHGTAPKIRVLCDFSNEVVPDVPEYAFGLFRLFRELSEAGIGF